MCKNRMAARHDNRNYHRSTQNKESWDKQDYSRSKGHVRQASGANERKVRDEKQRNDISSEIKPKLRQNGDWSEYVSSSGKKYYYNCKTEVSQWEKPKEWLELEKSESSNRKPANHHHHHNSNSNHSQHSTSHRSHSSTRSDYSKNCDLLKEETPSVAETSKRMSEDLRLPNRSTPVEQSSASKKRKDCLANSQSNSPKRYKNTAEQEAPRQSVPVTDEASCSNDGVDVEPGMPDTASDVDLQRLPELLVEIAEKYNIDLTHPDALEKLKHYLKSTLAVVEQADVEVDTEETKQDTDSVQVTVMDMSPETSVGSNSANQPLEVPSSDPSTEESVKEKEPEVKCPELPPLSNLLAQFFSPQLTGHASGWMAEHFERQARLFSDEAFRRGCLDCAQVSADLKCARSLVRTAEIRATLLEQRVMFLRQQNAILDTSKPSSSVT